MPSARKLWSPHRRPRPRNVKNRQSCVFNKRRHCREQGFLFLSGRYHKSASAPAAPEVVAYRLGPAIRAATAEPQAPQAVR